MIANLVMEDISVQIGFFCRGLMALKCRVLSYKKGVSVEKVRKKVISVVLLFKIAQRLCDEIRQCRENMHAFGDISYVALIGHCVHHFLDKD